VTIIIEIAALLGAGRLGGEVSRALRGPPVIGEILAGVVMGPTLLGRLAPALASDLFPATGPARETLDAVRLVAVTFLMLVAGLEVELSVLRRVGRSALCTGLGGLLVPFGLGLAVALAAPTFLGKGEDVPPVAFGLFFGASMAISALPVIARILLDLHLLRSDLGLLVMASAMLDDVFGWLAFSIVLGMSGVEVGTTGVGGVLLGIAVFSLVLFAFVRPILGRVVPWSQRKPESAVSVLAPMLALGLLGGAVTEAIGTHAVIGAFLVGVAIRTDQLRSEVRGIVHEFVTHVFAPIYFATIGLRVDFATSFSPWLVVAIVVVGCVGKFAGASLGARLAGQPFSLAFATAAGLNARGAMEIVLGELALDHGIIDRSLFTAIVCMALVTSLLSGPLMRVFLGARDAVPELARALEIATTRRARRHGTTHHVVV
jgi:Kef-type K+ transport system membrane component KefB